MANELTHSCETLSGMCDKLIINSNCNFVHTSVELTYEQEGSSVHFSDMEVVQDGSGTTHMKMYCKRDDMPTLSNYRRFPQCETKLSSKSKHSVLPSQRCRFAVRCTRVECFEVAAAKLMADMLDHQYEPLKLYQKLQNFIKTLFMKSCVESS